MNALGRVLLWLLPVLLFVLASATVAQVAHSQDYGALATATALTELRESIYATQTAAAQADADTNETTRWTSTPEVRREAAATKKPIVAAALTLNVPKATPHPPATPRPTATATAIAPSAEVLVQGLNLRSGPGVEYAVIGNATSGQRLSVLGQSGNCAWLKVELPNGSTAWASGAKVHTRLNHACITLALAAAPLPTPTVQPAQAPATGVRDSVVMADAADVHIAEKFAVPLPAPVLLNPPAGAVFDYYPRTTTLAWEAVPSAASYIVEVDCYHCSAIDQWSADVGVTFFLAPGITDTSFTFDYVGAQPGRWRVQAVNSAGQAGEKSRWREFTYTK